MDASDGKTDPRIQLKAIAEKLEAVTTQQEGMTERQGTDFVRFRHIVAALAAIGTVAWTVGTYYLSMVGERAKEPVQLLDKRVAATEEALADVRHRQEKQAEDTKDELRRVRNEVSDGNSSTSKKIDRIDEKLDRLLAPSRQPTTTRRGP